MKIKVALILFAFGIAVLGTPVMAQVESEWTLLLYYSADYSAPDNGDQNSLHPTFTLNTIMDAELSALIAATSNPSSNGVNIVVLADRFSEDGSGDGTFLYEIQDGQMELIEVRPEQNTADPDVLATFVDYGVANYPALHTMLVVMGEGMGWRGICLDKNEAGEKDLMTVHDIAEVLNGTAVDLLVFNGANMASVEVAYELRDAVPYLVATQSQIQRDGIPYGWFMEELIQAPETMDAEALAIAIVNAHAAYYESQNSGTSTLDRTRVNEDIGSGDQDRDRDHGDAYISIRIVSRGGISEDREEDRATARAGDGQIGQDFANMSAIRLSGMEDVKATLSTFASVLADSMWDLHNGVVPAARDAAMVGHWNDIDDYDYLADIYTFASVVHLLLDEKRELSDYPELTDAIADFQVAFDAALVAEAHADKFHNTNGLSIWYPGSLNKYDIRDFGQEDLEFAQTFHYEDPALALDFVTDSSWVDYLMAYFSRAQFSSSRLEVGRVSHGRRR